MNLNNQQPSAMHFKSAQIAGVELSPNDLAQINQYSLSPLSSDEIFAFKVSMAANEIDRDFEVFPRATLAKLANLFVGKTVVKDHDHKSDNQLARIYGTELVESDHMRLTRGGEVMTELIAKCYMVRTSKNADVIAEIQAGIRKEVSLGCRIGKAVCSICETDNVKTYCTHFAGKQYDGKVCYFSLEDPQDAYELSFVAIPAQQHAGTVKSYGDKPCYQKDLNIEKQRSAGDDGTNESKENPSRLIVNRVEENPGETHTDSVKQTNDEPYERLSTELSDLSSKVSELVALLAKNAKNDADCAAESHENTQNSPETPPNEAENDLDSSLDMELEERDSTNLSDKQASESLSASASEENPSDASCPNGSSEESEQAPATPTLPEQTETEVLQSIEADETMKDVQAQVRLRALEMAIALQRNAN